MYKTLRDALTALALNLENCRCREYDGTSNMQGRVKGLMPRVIADYPMAVSSYCASHCLNLVIQYACKFPAITKALEVVRVVVN